MSQKSNLKKVLEDSLSGLSDLGDLGDLSDLGDLGGRF